MILAKGCKDLAHESKGGVLEEDGVDFICFCLGDWEGDEGVALFLEGVLGKGNCAFYTG